MGQIGTLLAGEIKRSDMSVMVLNAPAFEKSRIDGLMGADFLKEFDLDLDFTKPSATLYRQRRCPQGGPNWKVPFEELPRPREGNALPANVIEVVLDGVQQNALLDTGANSTSMDRAKAIESGAPAEILAADQQGKTQGATVETTNVALHRFGWLKIGSDTILNPAIRVTEKEDQLGVQYFRMLIGEDYLRRRRIWIAYGDHKVFVSKAR
jgi:predicted aspartyl protease